LRILYVASEARPFAATGGLGDVLGSLPYSVKERLQENGDVRIIIPLYPSIRKRLGTSLTFVAETSVRLAWRRQYCGIWQTEYKGVICYFIDNEYYFKRESLYGSYDDGERFAFFAKGVLECMSITGFIPDILHANDWQSALTVIYLKRKMDLDARFEKIRTLYTIHNIDYQGIYNFSILADVFELAEWDRGIVEYNGCINLTKGAIVCADRVNTVSPRYASEIMTEYYSAGLFHILRLYSGKICGILNGIDTQYYSSENGTDIVAPFTKNDLSGKKENKLALQAECGLIQNPEVPIIAMISRLTAHKGFDLVCRVIDELLIRNEMQFVLLGTGEDMLEAFFRELEQRFPTRVCARIQFDPMLAKRIYAGADIFLMPSRSEPCGLAQMIASRYGTVPVVRETGGLADTIRPYNKYTGEGNGFSFTNYNAHEMMHVLETALGFYKDRAVWNCIVDNAMSMDFSWRLSAQKYIDMYREMSGGT